MRIAIFAVELALEGVRNHPLRTLYCFSFRNRKPTEVQKARIVATSANLALSISTTATLTGSLAKSRRLLKLAQKRVSSLAAGPNRAALTSEGAAYKGDLSSLDLIQNFLPVSPSKLGSRSVFSSLPQ